ncbi:2-hydroxyacid dehydrogenase [Bacillus sp. FJAT-45350]|uniref:2-hydroxyacid dehydrogenase n=1 Tax=Bacillus sp. FJAT-45350 TaxID=2011014 RepID=UPI000BB6B857|nr:D-glycerate dehydrogenase [Bacillus sp. FJAT-45350]
MKPKIFISKAIPKEVEEFISSYCDYRIWNSKEPISREALYKELEDIDGLLLNDIVKIDQELLDHAPRLKIVSNSFVGYNNFDLKAMKARDVIGTNTPHVLDDTVAELTLGLMLSVARRLPELNNYVKDGYWEKGQDEKLFGVDVHHSTIGIIGMGRIGEVLARKAKYGFDMEVLYHNRRRKEEVEKRTEAEYCSMEHLLKRSDFVVLLTPLTPETTNLIGTKEFELMKETAFFINVSRGGTVDEQALIEALQSKKIKGAGLDVFKKEPVEKDNPLLKMENVTVVPHIGSATHKTRLDMAMCGAKNLVKGVCGEQPPNIVE